MPVPARRGDNWGPPPRLPREERQLILVDVVGHILWRHQFKRDVDQLVDFVMFGKCQSSVECPFANGTTVLKDDDDAFFYDMLHRSDGTDIPIRVRSLGGLVPVTAAAEYHFGLIAKLPDFAARAEWFMANKPALASAVRERSDGAVTHRLLSVVPPDRLQRVLDSVFDEQGLLSAYGIRSISAQHRDHPVQVETPAGTASVDYEPAESTTSLFGGNSNWRGPIWFPLNTLLVESLRDLGVGKPVIPGIMPATSIASIARMTKLQGSEFPAWLESKMRAVEDDPKAVRAVGIEEATKLSRELLDAGVPGLHFITMNRSNATREIYQALGLTQPT